MLTVIFVLIVSVVFVSGLDIVNVSLPKKLTKLFYNANYGVQNNIEPGSMTYYTHTASGKRFVWYGVRYQINDTQFTSGVTSDVFDRNLINMMEFQVFHLEL